jgi:signal transduction histidine kinase
VNLVSNALKFTHAGRVVLRIKQVEVSQRIQARTRPRTRPRISTNTDKY